MIQAIRRTRTITSFLLLLAVALSFAMNAFHFYLHQHDTILIKENLSRPGQEQGVIQGIPQERLHIFLWPLIIGHLLAAISGLTIITIFANRLSRERRMLEASHQQLREEIEERKRTEAELRTIKEELEQRVQKRTRELEQINSILGESLEAQQQTEQSLSQTASHLRQRNRELSDFTHAISHDLKEPLILIQAFSERLHKRCQDRLDEQGLNPYLTNQA